MFDNIWLYSYHKFTYGTAVKGILIMARKFNQWKYLPYTLSNIINKMVPRFNDTNK